MRITGKQEDSYFAKNDKEQMIKLFMELNYKKAIRRIWTKKEYEDTHYDEKDDKIKVNHQYIVWISDRWKNGLFIGGDEYFVDIINGSVVCEYNDSFVD